MQAEVLLKGGTIVTQDRRQPRAQALAVAGGRVLGTSAGVNDLDELVGATTRVVELAGAAVVPGFVDAHVHFGHWSIAQQQVDLDQAATLEDGQALIREAVRALAPEAWVQGRGWDRNRWGRLPVRAELDAAVGGRGAALSSH